MTATTTAQISRVLVANRGEIARRVFATCRRLGIETVAVHSDADADLPFVAEADRAVRLRGDSPSQTYLRADLVLAAAARAGADAVHPGYGFLSENADFARAVEAAGMVWIGPSPEAIEAMGSKIGAKEIMRAAGVPVLEVPDEPAAADLPLLVKASAGGGGRGMRIVRTLADLPHEMATASAEAASAFGDGTVFVEPYVERGRHVEVQIWGDHGGTTISVLGARDCTVQRRHQKVVEESPPPAVDPSTLTAMYAAARAAGAAIGYRGVGTVEFLLDADQPDRFWFLEMNTRLQVEHPVTELVHGLDLVELQLTAATEPTVRAVPAGDPNGHAVEVRLYAEDAQWSPQSGPLVSFDVESAVQFGPLAGPGIRVDSGFAAGNEVGTHYDAMLAKVISWAPTRDRAVRQLIGALRRARLHGLVTNRDQLVEILADPAFTAMDVTTSWLETRPTIETKPVTGSDPVAVAAALILASDAVARRTVQRRLPVAWRNVVSQPQRSTLACGDEQVVVEWWGTRDGFEVAGMRVLAASPTSVRLEIDGVAVTYTGVISQTRGHKSTGAGPVSATGREIWVDGPDVSARLREVPRLPDPADQVASGSLLAPMPGSVTSVAVAVGDRVVAGDTVVVMEAMKMQHTVTAPTDGVVTQVGVGVGAQVAAGDVLATVEPSEVETGEVGTGEVGTGEDNRGPEGEQA